MTKLNPLEAYMEAGQKACKARKLGDEATAKFHTDWAKRAMRLEPSNEYTNQADAAFRAAYRKESGFN